MYFVGVLVDSESLGKGTRGPGRSKQIGNPAAGINRSPGCIGTINQRFSFIHFWRRAGGWFAIGSAPIFLDWRAFIVYSGAIFEWSAPWKMQSKQVYQPAVVSLTDRPVTI